MNDGGECERIRPDPLPAPTPAQIEKPSPVEPTAGPKALDRAAQVEPERTIKAPSPSGRRAPDIRVSGKAEVVSLAAVKARKAKAEEKADSKPPALGNRLYSQFHNQKQGWNYVLDLRRGKAREGNRHYRGYIRPDEWNDIRKDTTNEQTQIERIKAAVRRKMLASAVSRQTRATASSR